VATVSRPSRFPALLAALFALLSTTLVGCSNGGSHPGATGSTLPPSQTSNPSLATAEGPPLLDPHNIYAADGPNMLSPAVRGVPYRIYVPNEGGNTVDVIDPVTMKVIDHYVTGNNPQHVVPAWDLKTLYVANDLGNSLTPIDPMTGKPSGPNIPVDDPYNMYFTPDGVSAVVVAEARQHLDFRDAHTFQLTKRVVVDCNGVDHVDFAADNSYFIATCEFAGRLVKVDLKTEAVVGYLDIGGAPQDIKLDPRGQIFYVADKTKGGVHLIDAATFKDVGFIPTGPDAHGLYPSRDATKLYVTNRGAGSITVIDFATRRPIATWTFEAGASPDMGGVSPDGQVIWVSGRYSGSVYAISAVDGHLIAKIAVGNHPHGLCVWPQPGRYSLGHTGILR
jgi:YVTN family beta-propeller protein